ncbi:hypothetical protein BGX27_006113 [Mortierella sp. AM989]|nr:hypothetical protein BGX27_006113 [Mortierella sp. AM989]
MLPNLLSIVAIALAASSVSLTLAKPTGCKPALIKNLVVFGDSYSDTKNVYKLSNYTWPLPSNYHGRFSNGPVWADHVAKARNLKLQDYAFGAATSDSNLIQGYTGPTAKIPVPGFIQQIENHYAPKHNPKEMANTLFVVNFQGNDFFFNPSLESKQVVDRIHDGIKRLVSLGARNILVVQNTNMGIIPYFSTDAANAAAFTAIATKELAEYKVMMKEIAQDYGPTIGKHPFRDCKDKSKVNVGYLSLWDLYAQLYKPNRLKKLGITDVVNGCVSNDYTTVCKDADKHFYWDAFHPSAKIHKEVAGAVLRLL